MGRASSPKVSIERSGAVWATAVSAARAVAARRTIQLLARVRRQLLRRTLRYYLLLGDVQMCVSISRVFGQEAAVLCGDRRMRQWVQSYVALLHRARLWAPASTIMARAVDQRIRQTNQAGTLVAIGCAVCGATIDRAQQPSAVAPPQLQGPVQAHASEPSSTGRTEPSLDGSSALNES